MRCFARLAVGISAVLTLPAAALACGALAGAGDAESVCVESRRVPYWELCRSIADPATRAAVLSQTDGIADINNDGSPDTSVACPGGTMHVPCVQYLDSQGREIGPTPKGFEWNAYGSFVLRRFRYEGRTFLYHGTDAPSAAPVFVSTVTPEHTEHVVCEFETERLEHPKPLVAGADKLCTGLIDGSVSVETPRPEGPPRLRESIPYNGASVEGESRFDVDNDGEPELLAHIAIASGAGQGCDFDYVEPLTDDGQSIARGEDRDLLVSLQELSGRFVPNCGSARFFFYGGDSFYELRARGGEHVVKRIRDRRVEKVCAFEPASVTRVTTSFAHGLRVVARSGYAYTALPKKPFPGPYACAELWVHSEGGTNQVGTPWGSPPAEVRDFLRASPPFASPCLYRFSSGLRLAVASAGSARTALELQASETGYRALRRFRVP